MEARIGLAIAVALVLLQRIETRRGVVGGVSASPFNADVMLLLGAIFCTVAGYFALQPMLRAARAGEGVLSIGALHAASVGFYGLKTLLVLILSWRLSAR